MEQNTVHAEKSKKMFETLADLGAGWAVYGLKVGKLALEQSAKTLGNTAKLLDALAEGFQKKPEGDTIVVEPSQNDDQPQS